MDLRDWRTAKGYGLAEMARHLGIEGVNPGGTYVRIENGSRKPDADMCEKIIRFTGSEVGAADLHAVRLAWLRSNHPDKFPQDADRVSTAGAGADLASAPALSIAEAAE